MKLGFYLIACLEGFIYHDNSQIQMDSPKLQRERLSDQEMETIFQNRREQLQKFCKERYPAATSKSWQERPRHIYVADIDLGLLGCAPLKAGSSTWKAWWWYHLTPEMNHEGKSVPGHQNTISKIPLNQGEELLASDSKVRFLVVRHPLLRFYSGWHQKFAKIDPTSAQMLKKSRELQMLAKENLTNKTETMAVHFEDFVKFYAHNPKTSVNAHFDSIANHCDICSFKFDYIIKAETMNDEANYILRRVGLNIAPEDGFMHRNSQLTTDERILPSIMKPLLAKMNLTDVELLMKRYKDDYDAFGYDIDFKDLTLSGW